MTATQTILFFEYVIAGENDENKAMNVSQPNAPCPTIKKYRPIRFFMVGKNDEFIKELPGVTLRRNSSDKIIMNSMSNAFAKTFP